VGILSRRSGRPRAVHLAVGLAAAGGICVVTGMLVATLIADHSSSDSSPSSLIAIGLGSIGVILVVLGCVVLAAAGLGRLWRWASRAPGGGTRSRPTPR
jgi:UDP-N-acetylmuramyl pentapeptide phosphotransferase/UDP-N-acetylglucosamine-1-phosphate transferase